VYQALLTRRYLTSKVMPLLASVGVMLCSAMVMITWSVMGGFLDKLLAVGRTAMGDVMVAWPGIGFAHYEDLVSRLEAAPGVESASPLIETYGLITLPGGRSNPIIVKGIEGPSFDRVTGYHGQLWWRPLTEPVKTDRRETDLRLRAENARVLGRMLEDAKTLTASPDPASQRDWPGPRPGAVLGIEVSGFNIRDGEAGIYAPGVPLVKTADGRSDTLGGLMMPLNGEVVLNIMPLDSSGRPLGGLDAVTRKLPVVNEFRSGLFEIDKGTVYVPLAMLQGALNMDAAKRAAPREPGERTPGVRIEVDPQTGRETIVRPPERLIDDPARVTHVVVRGRSGRDGTVDARALALAVRDVYQDFAADHPDVPEAPGTMVVNRERTIAESAGAVSIRTWEDQNRTFIGAVKKEIGVVLFVFCFISVTAVFLVLAIFWSMVSEKTRDVGILRAIGASRRGVAAVWLVYGGLIGLIGSTLGITASYFIVKNINPIHEWLGRTLGLYVWDPRIYYFSEIPSRFDWTKAAIVFAAGVLCCVLGALIPSARAASMDPVKALRWE
jgi:lipoprotein-releasing system permease protein